MQLTDLFKSTQVKNVARGPDVLRSEMASVLVFSFVFENTTRRKRL